MTARGLRDYLEQKAESMRNAASERTKPADWHEAVEAVCVADDATGVRKLRIRDWQLIGDSGPSFGGWNLGPSSPELLCGVISTCLTHTYEIGAANLAIPLERIEIRVSAENNDSPFLGIESTDPLVPFNITARVRLAAPDASPDQLEQLHAYAARCPLTNLIRQPNDVKVVTD